MSKRIVSEFMTRPVVTIPRDSTLAQAHQAMRSLRIRHLPVLERKRLVGMVTERDLHLLETLKGVDQEEATVDEAMSGEPFAVEFDTPLEDVARTMVRRKLGSAVVMNKGKVVGLFTTIDALRALLAKPPRR